MVARNLLAAALFAAAVVLAGLYGLPSFERPHRAVTDGVVSILDCRQSADVERCVASAAERVRTRHGLQAALVTLREAFTHGTLPVSCHTALHQFGQIVAADIGVNAVTIGGAFCEGGFYHGVIAATGDIAVTAERCSTLPSLERAACWHGVGHAAYSLGIEPGLELCRDTRDAYDEHCQSGLFMEHVDAQQWPRPETLADYCAVADSDAVFTNCAQSVIGSVSFREPERAMGWCAEYQQRLGTSDGCYFRVGGGIGSSAVLETRDPDQLRDRLLQLCAEHIPCHLGAVQGVVVGSQDGPLGLTVCQTLPLKTVDRASCVEMANQAIVAAGS
jgi:hypothetical protein